MKIKLIYAVSDTTFETKVNAFLEEKKDKIEVVEIKWKWIFYHYAMIIYKEL